MANQNPEQFARDNIDLQLQQCGWVIQEKQSINLYAAPGVAVKEYATEVGPADYVLFVDQKPVGVIEAKREEEGGKISVHENQLEAYASARLKYLANEPLPFLYLSTGTITKFLDKRDPKPRYREVFTFHRPKTLAKWLKRDTSLRSRMAEGFPALDPTGLRDCQIDAITNLETSFKAGRPKALVQMATGSGKTFTAITSVYRLLKHIKAERILFLVDTKNLGEQAEGEFRKFQPQDDNRLFPELYGVSRLSSSFIPEDSQVYISTIQRLYSILKGTELDDWAEEENPNEQRSYAKEPLPVVYNEKLPIEFFDYIIIDECHRSIYNLWKQVLDYFDAFQVGLTATPDNRTFGYFNQNIVSDYGYEKAVVDGVLVPYNVYTIETQITRDGASIKMGEMVDKRERLTRKKFWEAVDEDIAYTGKQLDKDVVNLSIRPEPMKTIADPACGTGGFFLAAYDFIANPANYALNKEQKQFLKMKTFYGNEIVASTRRMALMNLFLHNIGDFESDSHISPADALISDPGYRVDYVLANPPFGKKSSMTFTNEEGEQDSEDLTYNRQDFYVTTSNKQLNFMQHIKTMLKTDGKAAVVLPDNVLFEGGVGETVRKKLLDTTNLHTILRLPTGIFYKQGVKANVLFFDNKPASKDPWTKDIWFYDFRTNIHFTLKKNPLKFEDLQDFIHCYNAENVYKRTETYHPETNPEGRWRKFTYADIVERDKTSLDITWIKDKSLTDLDNLPDPDVLAEEIIENLQSGIESFRDIMVNLRQ